VRARQLGGGLLAEEAEQVAGALQLVASHRAGEDEQAHGQSLRDPLSQAACLLDTCWALAFPGAAKVPFVPSPRVLMLFRHLLPGGRLCRHLLLAAALVTVALTLPAVPAAAAGSAELTVAFAHQPAAPSAGKHVSYKIIVHNNGPATALKVQIDFVTTAALTSPDWRVSTGRCMRSPSETACLFGTMKPGATATATISGTLSNVLPPGTMVKNTVTVASDTTLANPDQLVAHADYTTPGGAASPSPHQASADAAATAAGGAPVAAAAKTDRPGGRYRPLLMAVAAIGLIVAATALTQAVRLSRHPNS
jgi:hypothetical protein